MDNSLWMNYNGIGPMGSNNNNNNNNNNNSMGAPSVIIVSNLDSEVSLYIYTVDIYPLYPFQPILIHLSISLSIYNHLLLPFFFLFFSLFGSK